MKQLKYFTEPDICKVDGCQHHVCNEKNGYCCHHNVTFVRKGHVTYERRQGADYEIQGDTTLIYLNKERTLHTVIDTSDLPLISNYSWCLSNGYAVASVATTRNNTNGSRQLHHYLMNKKGSGLSVDHINRNRLDNRRTNLRLVTQQVNMNNISRRKDVNIYYRPEKKSPWYVTLMRTTNGVRKTYNRSFKTKEEAIKFRDITLSAFNN